MKNSRQIITSLLIMVLLLVIMPIAVAEETNLDQFPSDAVYFNGNLYKIYDESLSWTNAQSRCEDLGGHLVTINSEKEQLFLNELTKGSSKQYMRIGAYADSSRNWFWVSGEEFTYVNWSAGEPNNYAGREYKGMMYTDGYGCCVGEWNDSPDDAGEADLLPYGFICEWEGGNVIGDIPTLSDVSAQAFIGFLTNNGDLTEQQIKDTIWYEIMTGTYEGNDLGAQVASLCFYAKRITADLAETAALHSDIVNRELVEYLKNEIGINDTATERLIGALCNSIMDVFPEISEYIDDVAGISMRCSAALDTLGKVQTLVECIVPGIEVMILVFENEQAGRYTYFNAYINSREWFESENDSGFTGLMSYYRIGTTERYWLATLLDCFSWLTGKESFVNNYDLLDEWAEYIYQLGQSISNAEKRSLESLGSTSDEVSATIDSCSSTVSGLIALPDQINMLSVVKISADAFLECNFIEMVIIPESITEIEEHAFKNCISLQTVVMPGQATIKSGAFSGCPDSMEIICGCDNAAVIDYCKQEGIQYTATHRFDEYLLESEESELLVSECINCGEIDTIDDISKLNNPGDINGDDTTDLIDVLLLLRKLSGNLPEISSTSFDLRAANVTDTEGLQIDMADVTCLLQHITGVRKEGKLVRLNYSDPNPTILAPS